MTTNASPVSSQLANPSGCRHVRPLVPRVYRVTAIDQAGKRRKLSVTAINHHELHLTVARMIGGEPQFLSCCYDPAATSAARPAAPEAPARSPAPRVPRVHLVPDARPSAFGAPTDLDRALDAADSELEQLEQRNSPRSRRIALGWLIAAAAAGLAVWTAAAIGITALAAKSDRWPQAITSAAASPTH